MSTTNTGMGNEKPGNGIKLLSLDAGGPRAISQLHILQHVMKKTYAGGNDDLKGLEKPPCEVFDAIGGVGTGGLITILLVMLKLTATEALEVFMDFTVKVFKDIDQNLEKQTAKLKNAVQDILEKYQVKKDRKLIQEGESTPKCKLIIPIMYGNHVGMTCVLRNSSTRREPPTNITISDAMLATCANAPTFSPIVVLKDFSTFEYISGEYGFSNPVREIISSAHSLFGDQATVACLLSIGCGNPGITNSTAAASLDSQVDLLERVAMDSERAAQEIGAQMAQLTLYHRLSVGHGLEIASFLAWKDPLDVIANSAAYLNDLDTVDAVTRCIDALRDMGGFSTLEQLKHSGGAKIDPSPLPPLTLNYVERTIPMEFLENALFQADGIIKNGPKIVITTGIGGCGKTQLIRKFIEKRGNSFTTVFFVDGSSDASIKHDIVRHVRSLGAAHSQNSFEDSMRFLSQPVEKGQRLLIIDNVDDPLLDLSPFIPRWDTGALLVTSRNSSRRQLSPNSHLQLDVMSLDESVELLLRASGRSESGSESQRLASAAVAEELGFLPIALVQAASYMVNTGCTETIYITRLRNNRTRVLQNPATSQLDMRYKTAFAAFDASYNILPSSAQKTLQLISFLHRQKFPVDFVDTAATDGFSNDPHDYMERGAEFDRGRDCLIETLYSSGEWDPVTFDLIISSLMNHSLVTVLPAGKTRLLDMHPLVHGWARLCVPEDDVERFQDAAIRLLCCGATKNTYLSFPDLPTHVRALAPVWGTLHANDAASFGYILDDAGMYADATSLEEVSYNIVKRQLGDDHPSTITASASLAASYGQVGRYNDAEKLKKKVLEQRTKLLGTDHLDTIEASEHLASTYSQLGRYVEAEQLEEDVLRQRKRLLEDDHPDTIRASANLAVTYFQLGRYAEAEQLEVEVLKQRTNILGADDLETIRSSAHLATTYCQLERFSEAEELEADVLQRRTNLLGAYHPETIGASANLATTYSHLGRFTEAEELETEVLEQMTKLQGVGHPDTIRASANLAVTYYNLGRYDEAERLELEVLKQMKNMLGADHPETIEAASHLASTYYSFGRYVEAEKMEATVLQQRTKHLGDRHPETLRAMLSLAYTYTMLERKSEATALVKKARRVALETLGSKHTLTQELTDFNSSNRTGRRERIKNYVKRVFS